MYVDYFLLSDHKFGLIIYAYCRKYVDEIIMASMEAAVLLIKDAESHVEMLVNLMNKQSAAAPCSELWSPLWVKLVP